MIRVGVGTERRMRMSTTTRGSTFSEGTIASRQRKKADSRVPSAERAHGNEPLRLYWTGMRRFAYKPSVCYGISGVSAYKFTLIAGIV